MSTTFSKKPATVNMNSGIRFSVSSLRERLAEELARLMGDLNPYDVARRSNNRITPQGVSKIVKGESDLKVETLVILAEALGTTAPEMLIKALNPTPDNATADENRRLLSFYFDHVPEICQLYIVASARGIYQCQNTDAKIYERSVARATTRATLNADAAEHLADDQKEVAAATHAAGEGGNVTRLAAVPDKSQGAPVVSPRIRKPVDYRATDARPQDKRKRR